MGALKEGVVLALLLEACEVTDDMRISLTAAAKLLQDCTCQSVRAQESMAAVGLANAAMDRLERLNSKLLKLFGSGVVIQ